MQSHKPPLNNIIIFFIIHKYVENQLHELCNLFVTNDFFTSILLVVYVNRGGWSCALQQIFFLPLYVYIRLRIVWVLHKRADDFHEKQQQYDRN